MKRVRGLILFFVVFYRGLSFSAYAPVSHIKTISSRCPPSGFITIGLSGQASDYRSPVRGYLCSAEKLDSKQRTQCLSEKAELEQKAFEQKAQLHLKKSFNLPQCDFKFEFNGNKNKLGQRLNGCEVEVQGPGSDFPRSSRGMSEFYQLLRNSNYNISPQKCDSVSYSYRFRDNKAKTDPRTRSSKGEGSPAKSTESRRESQGSRGGRGSEYDKKNQDQSRTEAIGKCEGCSHAPTTGPLDPLIQLSRSHDWKKSIAPTCEPQGYGRGLSKHEIREMAKSGVLVDAIKRYSESAQGAIKRAFVAIVKPEKIELARKLTNNFESFNHLSHNQLREIVNTNAYGKCYQFVKAALSGDYSIIQQRHQAEKQAVAQGRIKGVKTIVNAPLLENQCNINSRGPNKGDLALSHRDWMHDGSDKDYSSYAAANAGPDLEKRGFINILDPEYGLSKNFIGVDGRVDENLLPEGAVIVHQCNSSRNPNHNFENYSNPYRPGSGSNRCNLGDISLKTSNGFISSYYGENPITRRHKYVVVGVYVKPMKEAAL